jgi:uncharacterized protein
MSIKINNLVLNIDDDASTENLKTMAAKKLKIAVKDIQVFKIIKESIDARKKDNIKFNYSVEIKFDSSVNRVSEAKLVRKCADNDVRLEEAPYFAPMEFGEKKLNHRPIIIGMGPAGIFAGLLMAQKGYKPIIMERGQNVRERTESVEHFWKTGELNTQSNVQFGEGGAGAFSDGKLTTRIKDRRCDYVLEELVKAGAPEEILYMGKPHIGTDILKTVVKNIRNQIIKLGGDVMFSTNMEDINITDKKVTSIKANREEFPCEALILAIGHSSRDSYELLYKKGIQLSPKPFAIGVRIEHKQSMIDEGQYGKSAKHPKLRAANYRLTYNSEKLNRSIYSFCMCPGGEVVAAASETGRLVTNGMSYYKRDKDNANSALAVTVGPKDFLSNSPLSGMEFQRYYEELAYQLANGALSKQSGNGSTHAYYAPVQLVGDFLKDRVSSKIGSITPSYLPGYEFKDLRQCLPAYITDMLKEGLINFDNKIKGFASDDAVLTGIETRTSAPLRIDRSDNFQSVNIAGLYPTGEGAGYAGGIISAAVDGLKTAEAIMKEYAPLS